jgi:hypothetical protein
MKKIISTIFVLFLFVGLTNAQPKNFIGVNGELAFASGNFADAMGYSTGFGGSARYETALSPSIAGYASVGYLTWSGDVEYDWGYLGTYKISTTLSAIVVMAGAKYYFAPNIYGVAEAGYSSFSMSSDEGESSSSLDSKFGFGAGAGVEFPLGGVMLDAAAMYKLAATDFNYIDVRVGVKFGI